MSILEYSIQKLSQIAGVSARTLRYYHEIGLLFPLGTTEAGYRFYGEKEVSLLQQILFYRERGFSLERIKELVYREDFDILTALFDHLRELEEEKRRLDMLIATVKKTIASEKGETDMKEEDKFEALKKQILEENESAYGQEARTRYGEEAVMRANQKMLNMTKEAYDKFQSLEREILLRLKDSVLSGISPNSEEGRQIALLHGQWLGMTGNTYTPQAHKGLCQMYLNDGRFLAYYDKEISGCAAFLREAVENWV